MAYFPLFIDLEGRDCLVAGGGEVALRKVRSLADYGAHVKVVAKEVCPGLRDTETDIEEREVCASDVDGMCLVVDATGDEQTGLMLSGECKKAGIPFNAVDRQPLCSFIFPAVYRKGALTLAVSTGGASPLAASWVRDRAAEAVPYYFDDILEQMSALRGRAKEEISGQKRRKDFMSECFNAALNKGEPLTEDEIRIIFEKTAGDAENKKENPEEGKVFLVGAGCGEADLITVRGLNIVRRADAIVYDDLVDTGILEYAKSGAEIIYAGKRSGSHSMEQSKINELLIGLAHKYRTVCRLKGGDPFVFGRGGEEALALREAGIRCESVPGISSAIAIPEKAGIPVTHRSVSQSFHVVTGHTKDTGDGLPGDLDKIAALDGTIIFLMGLGNLGRLSDRLMKAGMPSDTPAAVIGTETVRGPLDSIAKLAQNVGSPAVIAVGGSAGMNLWEDEENEAIHRTSVGLTGTDHFQNSMKKALEDIPAQTESLMKNRIKPLISADEMPDILEEKYDWIVFTSPNGVDVFFNKLSEMRRDIRSLSGTRFAVIGPETGKKLESFGIYADLMPESHYTDELGRCLVQNCRGARVLIACAENANPDTERYLTENGIVCRRLVLYRTVCEYITEKEADYVIFGSSQGVTNYFNGEGKAPRRAAVCIGSRTGETAKTFCKRTLIAEDTTPDAIKEIILKDMAGSLTEAENT